MTFGSLFSGIGGFDLGFERAGLTCAWQVELEPFCQKVLRYRFTAPVFDDVLTVGVANLEPVDVLCGGFPCQDVSVAGKGEGLDGERSGLFFEFARIAAELRPRFLVIENVPGLLTNRRGRDFHTVLTTLAERGFRRSYRILDSRYFGVAQRRRRVFFVCCLGTSGDDPRSVLFESESGGRGVAPSAEARTHLAATLRGRSASRGVNAPGRGGEDDENLVPFTWDDRQVTSRENRSNPQPGDPCHTLHAGVPPTIAFALRADPGGIGQGHNTNFIVADTLTRNDRNKSQGPSNYVVARTLTGSMHKRHDEDTDTLVASAITASAGHHGHSSPRGDGTDNLIADVAATLLAPSGGQRSTDLNQTYTPTRHGVRRLTPLECERVQGFPDGWTCLCGEGHRGSKFCSCPDTPRYKALGNAVTVPVAEWIGKRLMELL